jgi:hypothetical protein
MSIHEKLKMLLNKIDAAKDNNFEGVGIVISADYSNIPMISLKSMPEDFEKLNSANPLYVTLLELSKKSSPYHDGFHILNENYEIIKLSQFLAPPISISERSINYGSRYITALLTSRIPGVIATGVLGKSYSPKVFVNGFEV